MTKIRGLPTDGAGAPIARNRGGKAANLLAEAKQALAAGKPDEARRLCAACLALGQSNPAARHFMATLAWSAGAHASALDHMRAAVKLAPKAYPIRLDFARMLILARNAPRAIRESAAALALKPNDPLARFEHAKILYNSPRSLDAVADLEAVVADRPKLAEAHAMLAAIRIGYGEAEAALNSADRAVAAGLDTEDVQEIRGQAFLMLDRPTDAFTPFRRVLRSQPGRLLSLRGYASACARSGNESIAQEASKRHAKFRPYEKIGPADARLKVLVSVNLGPSGSFIRKDLRFVYAQGNYISTMDHPEVQRIYYPAAYVDPLDVLRATGGAQILFNNNSNAEVSSMLGDSEKLAASYAATGLPVINPVAKVLMNSREENYRRLGSDPAFVFPRTIRFDVGDDPEGAARRILREFEPPFLFRPIHTNFRGGLRLIGTRAELQEPPGLLTGRSYYAIDYHKCVMEAPASGAKAPFHLRASVTAGQIVPDRFVWGGGDFSQEHVERNVTDYDGRGLTDYERKFMEAPESILGAPLERIFANLIRTVGLDLFGIDFGITEDGRIIVFEANASMNLFNPKYEEYAPYRREHRARFNELVVSHFDKRIAEGHAPPPENCVA